VTGSRLLSAVLLLQMALPAAAGAAGAGDRLDRFRTLASTRLMFADVADPERAAEAYREAHALLDEEIVESLASGSVFASPAFLQDRLDGFADAWGGATLRLARIGPLTVATFQLGEAPGASSVRVYGPARGEPQLLAALQREGRPAVHPLPAAAGGTPQFAVVWEGAPTGRGTRPLRVDLVRQRGDDVEVVWTTAEAGLPTLVARDYRLRGGEMRLRYELRYPGWIPGCEQQTEQEDVFRLSPDGAGFVRVSQRQHNAWHRTLRQAVAALVAALGSGDRAALAALVPDPGLRGRLPASLTVEPACDAPDGPNPGAVSVAATTAEHEPWTLTFVRHGGGWRLRSASPVLQ